MRLRKNFAYQTIYRVLSVITPLITSPYLSRCLGAESLGVFSGTFAYANYFTLCSLLGVEYHGSRTIALCSDSKPRLSAAFWGIYYVQLCASFLAVALYYGTVFIVFSPQRRIVCAFQGLWILSAGADVNWYFFGRRKFAITATRSLVVKVVTIVCIFGFVRKPEDLKQYVFIMAFGTLFSQCVIWFPLLREIDFRSPVWRDIRENIRPMLTLFLPVLAFSAFHIMDKTMIDALSDELNGGCYYNVDKLINIPLSVCTGINTVMLPEISRLLHLNAVKEIKGLLFKSAEIVSVVICAIAFGIASIANVFVPVFFGNGYELCVSLIYLLVPVMIVKALSDFIRQQYLIPSHYDNIYITAVVTGALVNLFINYFLILKFGACGAAAATAIAEFLVLAIEIAGCMREVNFLSLIFGNWYYYFAGVVMFAAVKRFPGLTEANDFIELARMILFGGAIYSALVLVYWRVRGKSAFSFF